MPTDIGYTGQRLDTTGLMFYNARYYYSYLNRWIQPDTIVLDYSNPQSLNRFGYVNNNPLKYTDPSGHCGVSTKSGEEAQQEIAECKAILAGLEDDYGLAQIYYPTDKYFDENGVRQWFVQEARALRTALGAWANALGGKDAAIKQLGLSGMKIGLLTTNKMAELYGGSRNVGGKYNVADNTIYLAQAGSANAVTFAHELAHAFNARRNLFGRLTTNLFPGYAPLNFNDWIYGMQFGEYNYAAKTWTPDGGGWTDYAIGKDDFAPALPYEDFAETAAHSVLHTSKVVPNSARYAYMLALMPGLSQK
jgi:RHS repeat-associated protein